MGRAVNPEDDNWFGIQDPRKRKQIQDRLAQRARRKRLAESRKCPSATTDSDTGDNASTSTTTTVSVKFPIRSERGSPCLPSRIPRSPASYYQTSVPLSTGNRFISTQLTGSVYAALFNNGSVLGISCSTGLPAISRAAGPEIPESLHPTNLQLSTIHPTWIDRFPFPKMRDNMITLLGIINEEEFLGDLFCLTSFSLDPDSQPWDPAAWKIGREFSEKWGYLFY